MILVLLSPSEHCMPTVFASLPRLFIGYIRKFTETLIKTFIIGILYFIIIHFHI